MDDVAAYQQLFADFARQTTDAPLYARLAAEIADEPDIVRLLFHAAPAQRLPVLLFASVHWLLLSNSSDPLARFYPNLNRDAPPPDGNLLAEFRRFCKDHSAELSELLSTRSTQTNEIGRTALFIPAFATLEREVGPLVHIDAGASAGLNLLIPSYDFDYQPGGAIESGSTVRLTCGTRGPVPVPSRHPDVAAAIGVDATPVDVRDPEQARWLEACVWPDQVERFDRLTAAIEIAKRVGTDVRRGDVVESIGELVEEAGGRGHPVITTSWVMNYLQPEQRHEFAAALDRVSLKVDCSWVYLESPALCPELPGVPSPRQGPKQPTALVIVRWRWGERSPEHLADCHPHGRWISWKS